MTIQYSELQLDALRELANIGSGNAATALSQMLGRPIDVSVPNALALPLADAVDAVGAADTIVTGVALPVFGDLDAIVLMLFSEEDEQTLCTLLGVEAGTEVGRSALGEIGNILGCSYIGALGAMTGLVLEPAPPQTVTDMLAAIVETVLASHAEATHLALLLDSDLIVENAECSFSFMLVPNEAGVAELLSRLGL
ncbi:MAG TPA: chemotaxis protein CheC [Gaiellaceae bacterium]|nr:chemotaxis protein CheC [Gaiellaceae bacterium]